MKRLPITKELNMKKIITKKRLFTGTAFTLIFAGGLAGAYAITPNRVRKVETSINTSGDDQTPTYFNKFVSKLSSTVEDDEQILGLSASIDDLSISYPSKDGLLNNQITINGDLNILMRCLNDFDFTVDLDVNYNNKHVDLGLGLVEKDFYFALNDLRIKSSNTSTLDALDYIMECFFDPENEDGLGLNFDVEKWISGQFSDIDFSSLLSSFGGTSSLSMTETVQGNNVHINISVSGIDIEIIIDKESLAIKKIDLGTMNIGDVQISGEINCSVIDSVLKLDDPSYPKQRGEFVEAISYIGWVDRLLDLFKSKKLGLDFNLQATLEENDVYTTIADLTTEFNLDATNVIDFNQLIQDMDDVSFTEVTESIKAKAVKASSNEETEEKNALDFISKLEFGLDASVKGQDNEEYSNISLSYFDNASYLTFNEDESNNAVMRAKLDNSALSSLIKQVPEMVSSLTSQGTGSEAKVNAKAVEETSEDLFAFITSSELITAINNNDFSGILDVIKNISNDNGAIYLDLDLSSLGLGANAEVNLVLDSNKESANEVLAIDVKDITIGNLHVDAQLATDEFNGATIEKTKEIKDQFDEISFVPGILNQTSSLLDAQRGLIDVSGSILDDDNQGYVIDGKAQFDALEKVGYGKVNLREYSSKIVNSNKYVDHVIDFDIDNRDESLNNKNARVVYNKNLKAKLTVQTFVDIFDLFKDLLQTDDERFTKFNGPIVELLLGGAISEIITSKDFIKLTKSSFLKSIKQVNNGNSFEVVINGSIFEMESDITVRVNFKVENNEQHLDGIEIVNLKALGKNINMNIRLADFNESFTSSVNVNDNFMDFSQIKVLLDFGINTTKLAYYHLTASVDLQVSVLKVLSFDLDFHITVDGKKTKVYGSIPKVPWLSDIASDDIATTSVSSEFVFEPTEDIGGVFHIVRNEDHLLSKDEVVYYQATSDKFVESIIQYLVVDMLNIRSSAVDGLSNSSISTEKSYDSDYSKLFTENGFAYSKSGTTNTWDIGINLNQIIGNDTLGALYVTLNGKDDGKSGLFTTAHVTTSIASLITVNADITLVNPSFTQLDWSSDIEAKYQKVMNWYNNLSDANKAAFDANYKNNPLKGWTMVSKRGYF